LLAAAADGFVRHGLVELAEQPYIGTPLDAEIINHVGYQHPVHGLAGWAAALQSLERDTAAHENDPDAAHHTRRPPPPLARVRAAREAFQQFAGRAAVLLYQVPGAEYRVARADAAAWGRLRAVAAEWGEALHKWDTDRTILTAAE